VIKMSRHIISKKDYKILKDKLLKYNIDISNIENIEIDSSKKNEIYYFSGKPIFYNNIPTLYLINYLKIKDKTITVDDGAVPHIENGSNLFAPGIVNMDNTIKKDDIVFIKNKNNLFIAIGISLDDYNNIIQSKKGEAVKIIHYLNDKIMELQ